MYLEAFCCVCGAARARRWLRDGRTGERVARDGHTVWTWFGLSTCRFSSLLFGHGPISANRKVADAMVPMATARCVGNGVKPMSINITWGRVVHVLGSRGDAVTFTRESGPVRIHTAQGHSAASAGQRVKRTPAREADRWREPHLPI